MIDNVAAITVPLVAGGGTNYLLGKMGVPMIVNIPVSLGVFVAIGLMEQGRQNESSATLYEWYIELFLLGGNINDINARHTV
jgi:hypothetical protein